MKQTPNAKVCALLQKVIDNYNYVDTAYNKTSYSDFLKHPLPNNDVQKAAHCSIVQIASFSSIFLQAAKQLLSADSVTNAIMYLPESYMSWHTNSDNIGTRMYYTYTNTPGVFRYLKDDYIYDDWDCVGWTVRSFNIDKNKPLWHSIYAPHFRYSFGFNFNV
jgi:hypothetical protein